MFRLAVSTFVLAFFAGSVAAAPLDPTKPEDALQIARKIHCSQTDGEAITYWWHGSAYSHRTGERDRLLFDVEGMNVRQCAAVNDPKTGPAFRLVSREILLYKDAATGKALATWDNPWTGETVDVLHVANDPVNSTFTTKGRDGKPQAFNGDMHGDAWWLTSTVPLFYPNVLGGSYEAEIGGTYHATEMFNFHGSVSDLLDREKPTAMVYVGWARMSDWLPWMKMNGREGFIYMHTAGKKLAKWDDLSETMKSEIKKNYPEYAGPPPIDDTRKNETSWTYYKKVREGTIIPPKRAK